MRPASLLGLFFDLQIPKRNRHRVPRMELEAEGAFGGCGVGFVGDAFDSVEPSLVDVAFDLDFQGVPVLGFHGGNRFLALDGIAFAGDVGCGGEVPLEGAGDPDLDLVVGSLEHDPGIDGAFSQLIFEREGEVGKFLLRPQERGRLFRAGLAENGAVLDSPMLGLALRFDPPIREVFPVKKRLGLSKGGGCEKEWNDAHGRKYTHEQPENPHQSSSAFWNPPPSEILPVVANCFDGAAIEGILGELDFFRGRRLFPDISEALFVISSKSFRSNFPTEIAVDALKIGVKIFERTTRKVTLTEARAVLLRETEALPNILAGALRRIREDYLEGPREIKVGLSSSLAQAHIPGIFHSHQKAKFALPIFVSQDREDEVLRQVAAAWLDVGIIADRPVLPATVEVTHEMKDEFCAIVAADHEIPEDVNDFGAWAEGQAWLLPPTGSCTRRLIDDWARRLRFEIASTMELESFDLMNQFVALGMGAALVPRRSLSAMIRKHQVRKVGLPRELARNLIVIAPRYGTTPDHVREFVKGILFS